MFDTAVRHIESGLARRSAFAMVVSRNESKQSSPVILLCPNCDKRLPLSGTLSMRGTTGIYCRHCHRTVQVTMDLASEAANDQDE